MKFHTSSTVQFEISSCNLGLSLSDLFGVVAVGPPGGLLPTGVFVRGLFVGGAAAERSSGEEESGRFTFLSKPYNQKRKLYNLMIIKLLVRLTDSLAK